MRERFPVTVVLRASKHVHWKKNIPCLDINQRAVINGRSAAGNKYVGRTSFKPTQFKTAGRKQEEATRHTEGFLVFEHLSWPSRCLVFNTCCCAADCLDVNKGESSWREEGRQKRTQTTYAHLLPGTQQDVMNHNLERNS